MTQPLVIILAAGEGKRMNQGTPKVLLSTKESPLINHMLLIASEINPSNLVVVTGFKREMVESHINSFLAEDFLGSDSLAGLKEILSFAFQEEQLGTGDAVKAAIGTIRDFTGTVVVLNGDMPLIKPESIKNLLKTHQEKNATVSVLSAVSSEFKDLGRIIRTEDGQYLKKIVEAKDCSPSEYEIKEVNVGLYAIDSSFLSPALEGLSNDNSQKEYYLTDVIEKASNEGQIVIVVKSKDENEAQGVNTPKDLFKVNKILRERLIERLISTGVEFEDTETVYIDPSVTICSGVYIGPNVQIKGSTKIEDSVKIEGTAYIKDSIIGTKTTLKLGIRIEGSIIGKECIVGPFANIRPNSVLKDNVKVGNFVELKKAVLEDNVAASHLSYLGDCSVGARSNIGAGTITCNYDGTHKHHTEIKEDVFIGSNSSLVAPVVIGKGATIGAGSTIQNDIPEGALGLTRAALKVKEGYRKK